MSKLIVEVCKIEKIEPIPNADRIVLASIKGWNCIIGKDTFGVGDLVIFVPPDAVLPTELIESQGLDYLKKGSRVMTIKLKGYISQGLCLSVNALPRLKQVSVQVGDDVADILGITKWEPVEAQLANRGNQAKKRLSNPKFDKYTDIDNVKHYPTVFEEGEQVVITEKIHGANWRCGHLPLGYQSQNPLTNIIIFFQKLMGKKYEFVYGSHNVQLQWFNKSKCFYKDNIYEKMVERYNIKSKLLEDMIVYGEVYGTGVQDLTYGLSGIDLVVFDVKYKGEYLSYTQLKDLCSANGWPTAPELYVGPFNSSLVVEHTNGTSTLCPSQIREGCVIKPLNEIKDPRLGRKILKSINPDYLLRKGGTELK